MSVILRVDDFPGTKPEEFWKHNLDNFKLFDAVLEKYVDEYVLGVIPKYTTEEMIRYLEQNDKIRVALHGVEHNERFPNEFRPWETTEQIFNKLVSARQPFQKCNGALDVVDYIPPHNVIDMKTVDALKLAGFKRIYGGPGSDEHVIWHAKDVGLKFDYSQWPYWYGRSDELLNRDKAHLMINSNPDRVVTLHWPWEWNIGLDNLERFLEEIKGVLR